MFRVVHWEMNSFAAVVKVKIMQMYSSNDFYSYVNSIFNQ